MQTFSQQNFNFAWKYFGYIPTNNQYFELFQQIETAISSFQSNIPLTSQQTSLLFEYSQFCGFSWANGKIPKTKTYWDQEGIVEQDFNTPHTPVYYLEAPNPDNPTGTIYQLPNHQPKQPKVHFYTSAEFFNLNRYEQEVQQGIFSTDGIKELFKFRQQKGFTTYLE